MHIPLLSCSPWGVLALYTNSRMRYYGRVIKSYRDEDTQAIAERRRIRKFPEHVQRRAQIKLMIINNSKDLNDLRMPPGSRLEILSGDRRGQYSIRVNEQWRICFDWDNGDAYQVEIVDYH